MLLAVARLDGAIGGDQVEIAGVVARHGFEHQAFGRGAGEHVPAQLRPGQQLAAGVAHRIEPLQLELQLQRHVIGVGLGLGIGRQHQRRFEIRQPRRHDEIIGGELEAQRLRVADEGQILVDQIENRNLRQIDLLVARQREEQIERPFPTAELENERRRRRGGADGGVEVVVGGHGRSLRRAGPGPCTGRGGVARVQAGTPRWVQGRRPCPPEAAAVTRRRAIGHGRRPIAAPASHRPGRPRPWRFPGERGRLG